MTKFKSCFNCSHCWQQFDSNTVGFECAWTHENEEPKSIDFWCSDWEQAQIPNNRGNSNE